MKKFQVTEKEKKKRDAGLEGAKKGSVLTTHSFGEYRDDPLEQPLWMLVINIVAFDLQRFKDTSLQRGQRSEAILRPTQHQQHRHNRPEVTSEKEKSKVTGSRGEKHRGSGERQEEYLGQPIGWHSFH